MSDKLGSRTENGKTTTETSIKSLSFKCRYGQNLPTQHIIHPLDISSFFLL